MFIHCRPHVAVSRQHFAEFVTISWLAQKCSNPGFSPWVGKIPGRRKWQPPAVHLLGKPIDGGAWQATAHGVARARTPPSAFTVAAPPFTAHRVKNLPAGRRPGPSQGREDPLEKGMASHSSILAWRISQTEEPAGATVHGLKE